MTARTLRSSLVTLAALALLGGCAIIPVPGFVERAEGPLKPLEIPVGQVIEGERPQVFGAGCALTPDEAVVVVSAQGLGPDPTDPIRDYPRRVHEWLDSLDPPVRMVDEEAFRDALFPWFEPGLEPFEPGAFAATVRQPVVHAKIEDLDLRYLIAVDGRSAADDVNPSVGWAGLAPGWMVTIWEQTDVTARVFDLKRGTEIGTARASATGPWVFMPLFVAAVATVPLTERTAYNALTDQLEAFLRGDGAQQYVVPADERSFGLAAPTTPVDGAPSSESWTECPSASSALG